MFEEELRQLEDEIKQTMLEKFKEKVDSDLLSTSQKLQMLKEFKSRLNSEPESIRMKVLNQEINDKTFLNIDSESYSVSAYIDFTLDQLINTLKEEDFLLTKMSIPDDAFPEDMYDSAKENTRTQIIALRAELFENHYSNIHQALCLFAELCELIKFTGSIKLIKMKNSLANLIIEYNKEFSLKTEFFNSSAIFSVVTLIDQVNSYLSGQEYLTMLKNSATSKVNALKVNDLYATSKYESSFKNLINRNRNKNSNLVKTAKVNVITVSDLDKDRPDKLNQRLSGIQNAMKLIKVDTNHIFEKIRNLGFDIYTGEVFGEVSNAQMMDFVKNTKYLKEFFEKPQFLESDPKIYVKNTYKVYIFPEKFSKNSYGDLKSVLSLTPGETRELKCKTVEQTKEERMKTSTVFDSNSIEAQEDLENSVEDQRDQSNSDSKELTRSKEINKNLSTELTINAGISGVGVDASVEAGIDTSESFNSTINNTREQSAKNIAKTLSKHTQKTAGQRDVTVSENTQVSTESSKEESSIITIANPNRASNLNVRYHQGLNRYSYIITLDDVYVGFLNSKKYEEYHISEIDTLLSTYIKSEKAKEKIRTMIAKIATTRDYQSRNIEFLGKDLRLKKADNYFKLLRKQKQELSVMDNILEDYLQRIQGIPIRYEVIEIPGNFLLSDVSPGNSALDENEQRLLDIKVEFENTLANMKKAEVAQVEEIIYERRQLFDKKIMALEPETASYQYFLSLQDTSKIYDKSNLLNLVSHTSKTQEL